MKNKKILVGIAILAILGLAGYFFLNDDETKDTSQGSDSVTESTQSEDSQSTEEENNKEQKDENLSEEKKVSEGKKETEEASYEEWLAASMVTALTMQYEDAQFKGIYYKSKQDVNEKMKSKGVYVVYEVDGETYCIESKPLEEENTNKGVVNLYSQNLGFSTYNNVDMIKTSKYKELKMDDLGELISKLMMVSIYEN